MRGKGPTTDLGEEMIQVEGEERRRRRRRGERGEGRIEQSEVMGKKE